MSEVVSKHHFCFKMAAKFLGLTCAISTFTVTQKNITLLKRIIGQTLDRTQF